MPKNKTVLSLFVFLSFSLLCSFANALSLGDIKASSTVGEKLNAIIEVDSRKNFSANQVLVSIAPRSVYERLGVYWEYSHSSLNFEVSQIDGNSALIKLTSSEVIYEPYLEFVISVRWPEGLLTKSYTLLLDMKPVVTGGGISAPAPEPVIATSEPESAVVETRPIEKETVVSSPVAAPEPVTETASNPQEVSSESQANKNESNQAQPSTQAAAASDVSQTWRIKAKYGDTLWSIAKQVEAESGVNVWNAMSALYENNPQAFGDSEHELLANANLSVSGEQLEAAPRMRLKKQQAVEQVAAEVGQADKSRRERREESAAEPEVTETAAKTESIEPERKLLSVVADGEKGADSLSDQASAAGSDLSGDAAPIVGEVDGGNVAQADEAIDESLGEARQRVEDIETRLDVLLKQYEELNKKTEELKELEQDLNRRIAERTLQGIDAPPSTAEVQPGLDSDSGARPQGAADFFARYGWLILAFALALLVALIWLVFTRPDRMVPVAEEAPEQSKGEPNVDAATAEQAKPREDWDDTAFMESKRFSDEELAEMVKLKGEKAFVENQTKESREPVDYGVSDGATELQVAMYIAYERYDEAEELINASLLNKPDNTPLKLQLLEIFAARNDREQFDQLAEKLEQLNDPDVSDTIKSLGDF